MDVDLPALLQRITALANESTDTPATLQRAAADVAATVGLSSATVAFPPVGVEQPGRWSFPVTVGGEVAAMLRFGAPAGEPAPPPELSATMEAIARQLAIVIERDRIQQALRTVQAELERSNRELEQFAYVASHDLQEPLRKIVGFGELLEGRYAEQLEGEASEFLGYVTEGARRMSRLIEDLLRYSRVGRARPALRPLALDTAVGEVIEVLSGRIAEADAVIEVDGPLPTVMADHDQMRDLLTNLVGNALKYRNAGAPHVRVTAEPADGDRWAVSVADDGIGIDPVHAERVFEVFQRLHPRGQYEGSGIGLAICRRIVEHHGGRIWVDSRPDEGATFTFTVPAVPEGTRD